MTKYQDMNHMDDLDQDPLDIYFYTNDEGSTSKLDIIHLFGKEKLENIQNSLSKATGLAFVTVDFKGEPITETTLFSKFCRAIRSNPAAIERCKASDAFGSIQAAVTKKTNVYYCPCGLLEVAIPIIVRGHYLGGFVGGQIRCEDAPDSTSRLASVLHSVESEEIANKYQMMLDEIPVYSYEKFLDIANLVFLVINQLSENEINKHVQEDVLKKRLKKSQSSNRRHMKENIEKDREIQELKIQVNPYETLDMLTALLNLSIIEEASQTNELLSSFIEYTKYKYMEKETFVQISGELEYAERYLKLQQKKLGERLEYTIRIPEEMSMQKMPSNVLLPYVQNAVYNGIMLKKEGGKLAITGYLRNNNLVLEITDTGPGLSEEEVSIKYETYKEQHEGYYIKLGMDYAKDKVRQLFGEGYDIIVETHRNKGCKSILIWPERQEERTE